jgi:integrase/recombinase XerD
MNSWQDTTDADALFDREGARKYVCASELRRFLEEAARCDPATLAFCRLLACTGCRISEALSLTGDRIDHETGRVILRTLKRRRVVHRAVPVPPDLIAALRSLVRYKAADAPVWSWSRQTGWRRIKQVMAAARIIGPQATAKGLRHAFGVVNAEANIPPSLTRRWMGHARLETTAIYQHAVGREERSFARRIWKQTRLPVARTGGRSVSSHAANYEYGEQPI